MTSDRIATEDYADTAVSGATAAEFIRDTIGTALTNGANITVTVSDVGDTITIAVTGLTKSTVGLANVDNTADTAKPVSTAQQTALNLKANIASPTFTGTVTIPTGASITAPTGIVKGDVGLGNVDNVADASKPVSTATQTALDLKAPLASPAFTGTPTGITKSHVGLGSADNTADTAKPVSTAQQTALNLKANIASPTFTGTVTIPTGGSITAPTGLVKGDVGLGNVDNTTDAGKPVSTAQQTALDLKAPLASPTFTGTVAGVTKTHVGLGNVDNVADASKVFSGAQITSGTVADARIDSAIARDSEVAAAYQPLDADLTALAAGGGWLADTNTWTRTGNLTFTLSVDATGWLTPGTKISVSDTTTKYGVIATSVFSAGTTTVTLITTDDAVGTLVSTLTVPRYSYADNPVGFPAAFAWTPTLSGWSSNPTSMLHRWSTSGRKITLFITHGGNGTSNATSHTATLPVTAATVSGSPWGNNCKAVDNNVVQTGLVTVASAGTTIALVGILATTLNTNSGNSRINQAQVTYEF